jgi:hypothetical protein
MTFTRVSSLSKIFIHTKFQDHILNDASVAFAFKSTYGRHVCYYWEETKKYKMLFSLQ